MACLNLSLEALSESTNLNGEKVKLISAPGSKWSYSGGGYTLLQLIIEEITRMPFANFMQEEILHPLGMFNSSFNPSEEELNQLATPYAADGSETARLQFVASGAAGLQSTPEDLAAFATAALDRNGKVVAGRGVLKPQTVAQMTAISSSAPLPDGRLTHRHYGLGYFISSSQPEWFGHGGDNRGWHSRFILYPQTNDGVVILTNSSNGFWLAQNVYCLIAQALVGGDKLNCS